MAKHSGWSAQYARFMDRVQARLSARAAQARAFVSSPEPRTIGHFAKGRQLIAGNFLVAGHLIEAPDTPIWDIGPEDAPFSADLQGCAWLDDLAAVGDAKARAKAQDWVFDWIRRYGGGSGPGWDPDLTGRRVIRWINHAIFLLRGREAEDSERFFKSLAGQTIFLSRRYKSAAPGLPRFEALTGLIYAGMALEGMEALAEPAITALAQDCIRQIDGDGGIPSRNPEELLEVLTLLVWATQALTEADRPPPEAILSAVARVAPTLRALRHADGALARFHGGGRGLDGRLDSALAASGNKTVRGAEDLSMGFARLAAGRTTIIVDAAPPPKGAASHDAHASTLAFELTSGRRPLIVNCGSGRSFGPDWRRAGRATASHSTLSLTGVSSSRMAAERAPLGDDPLADGPVNVPVEWSAIGEGTRLQLGHDGWRATHGLTHARTLDLTDDGRGLSGEDLLTTLSEADRRRFDRVMDDAKLQGIPFAVRFHLHPEVEATLDLGGTAVSLALRSGEIWVFRQDGSAQMTLEPSVYLENGRLRPRAAQQVVLTARAMAYATRVRWSLSKAHETPDAVRDYAPGRSTSADTDNEDA